MYVYISIGGVYLIGAIIYSILGNSNPIDLKTNQKITNNNKSIVCSLSKTNPSAEPENKQCIFTLPESQSSTGVDIKHVFYSVPDFSQFHPSRNTWYEA